MTSALRAPRYRRRFPGLSSSPRSRARSLASGGGGGGAGLSVTDGLFAHYDATTLELADAASVATWADASGNGHDATQSEVGWRPVFRLDEFGEGLHGVEFRGRLLDTGAFTAQAQPTTIYVVVAVDNGGTDTGMVFITSDSSTDRQYLYRAGAGGTFTLNAGSDVITHTAAGNTTGIHRLFVNGAASHHRYQGVDVGPISPGADGFQRIVLGSNPPNSLHLDCTLGEFIVYNRLLGVEEDASVLAYLASKWGMTG